MHTRSNGDLTISCRANNNDMRLYTERYRDAETDRQSVNISTDRQTECEHLHRQTETECEHLHRQTETECEHLHRQTDRV